MRLKWKECRLVSPVTVVDILALVWLHLLGTLVLWKCGLLPLLFTLSILAFPNVYLYNFNYFLVDKKAVLKRAMTKTERTTRIRRQNRRKQKDPVMRNKLPARANSYSPDYALVHGSITHINCLPLSKTNLRSCLNQRFTTTFISFPPVPELLANGRPDGFTFGSLGREACADGFSSKFGMEQDNGYAYGHDNDYSNCGKEDGFADFTTAGIMDQFPSDPAFPAISLSSQPTHPNPIPAPLSPSSYEGSNFYRYEQI